MSPLVRRQAAYGVAYITPGMLIILMFCIAPIFMTLYYSFTEYNLAQPPDWIALENYVKVLNNTQLRRAVVNTVIYVIITVPLQTLLAMFVANFLAEYLNNRYGRVLRSIIFIPTLASYVAAATVWKVILASRGGLLNEILGIFGVAPINWLGEPTLALICVSLVAVWKSAGYFTIIFYAGIMNISVDVREAALIDGASPRQRFWKITVPLLKPITYLNVTLGIIWSFQAFDIVYKLTGGGPFNGTTTIAYIIYTYAFQDFRIGYASAVAILLLLVILAVHLIQQHFFEGGDD
ncbi:MAG TPA: sugar ABC transporter permease [Candidatus Scatomorpha stercorigallinarum]|nr:sugar ABC transporter permease [Candidatus Scatomorpha stercorigallinarum]